MLGGRGWGTAGPDGCLLSPQLSGLLQVCVRTGTETQAKFTSVELLRAYISVRGQWNTFTGRFMGSSDLFTREGIFLKTELRPQPLFSKPMFTTPSEVLDVEREVLS